MFERRVGRFVIARIVVGGDQQLTRLHGAFRRRILRDVTVQHVDRLVEEAAAQFVLQLAVVEQSVLGDRGVERLVGRHGERLHGALLVAAAQIAVGQMIGGVLRQRVVRSADLLQTGPRLVVTRLPIEAVTQQVVFVAPHLTAAAPIGVEELLRTPVIAQMKPPLGHDTLQLGAAFARRTVDERAARRDHIAVITLVELDLQQIERRHGAVGRRTAQLRKSGSGRGVVAPDIGDIGDVVERMIRIFARRGDAAEIAQRIVVIALLETDVPHADVVLLAVFGRQGCVVDLAESPLRLVVTPRRTQKRREGEFHVVDMDRFGIPPQELGEPRLGPRLFQLHGAHRHVIVGLGTQRRFRLRNRTADCGELLPGIGPAPQCIELAPPIEMGPAAGRQHRRIRPAPEAAQRRDQHYHSFTHRSISLNGIPFRRHRPARLRRIKQ